MRYKLDLKIMIFLVSVLAWIISVVYFFSGIIKFLEGKGHLVNELEFFTVCGFLIISEGLSEITKAIKESK